MNGITVSQQYYYHVGPDDQNLYYCPYAPACLHKPTWLKPIYHKYLNSHFKPFQCEEQTCNGIRFSNKADCKRHKKEIHGEEILCAYERCKRSNQGQGFNRQDNLKRHVELVHKKKKAKYRRRKTGITNPSAKSDPRRAQVLHSPEARKAGRKLSELENKNAEMGELVDSQLKKIVHTEQKNKELQQENETLQEEKETLQQEKETLQQVNETLQQVNEKLQQENFALQVRSSQSFEILSGANTMVSTQNLNLDHQISQGSAIELDQLYPWGWMDFWSDCSIVSNPVLQTCAPAPVAFTNPFTN
ncbi:hypothetical protein K469DRAFT_812250 [Zopfia rhizophila CBS 207.26]|uniref:C2H2-type domain-containing protein n=1 Tax=Zopfia rhizophila CBS 207.26 TaxID=1314779 RepID=A0A6A6DBN4_9PEZI|nr:hypothetical protein K469DRAFT_812250 [Zopfia rhizophila CBS 207.26]